MAGDWLKVEKDTPEKPEVLIIATKLAITPDEAFGKCFRFWRWADSNLVDGNAASVTESVVDALVGAPGFAHALLEVGWLAARNGSLQVPNFDRHMSQSAKRRALTAKRVSQHKKRSANDSVTLGALPREEKRREEEKEVDKKDSAELDALGKFNGYTLAFGAVWDSYPATRRVRKPVAMAAWKAAIGGLSMRFDGGVGAAEQWLHDRLLAFCKSPLARSKFCPSIDKWLNEGRFDDTPEAWQVADDSGPAAVPPPAVAPQVPSRIPKANFTRDPYAEPAT